MSSDKSADIDPLGPSDTRRISLFGLASERSRKRARIVLVLYLVLVFFAVISGLGIFSEPPVPSGIPLVTIYLSVVAVLFTLLSCFGYYYLFSDWSREIESIEDQRDV